MNNISTTVLLPTFLTALCLFTGGKAFTQQQKKVDTVAYHYRKCPGCKFTNDTIIYRRMKCGLYKTSKGQIAFQTLAMLSPDTDAFITVYMERMLNAPGADSNGYSWLKSVIDTNTFRILNMDYWKDKNHVYGYNPMSDGGTCYMNSHADPASFVVIDDSRYARDKNHIFYRGEILSGADIKSFRLLNKNDIAELARDDWHYYEAGSVLSDKEIKEYKLSPLLKK